MTTILRKKWGFDSNIIVYALDADSKYHKRTKELLVNLRRNREIPHITHQNILEVEKVLTKVFELNKNIVIEKLSLLLDSFNFTFVSPHLTTIHRYHKFFSEKEGKKIFDLYLAATYIDNGINQMYTANEKDFAGIPNFKAVNPYKKIRKYFPLA